MWLSEFSLVVNQIGNWVPWSHGPRKKSSWPRVSAGSTLEHAAPERWPPAEGPRHSVCLGSEPGRWAASYRVPLEIPRSSCRGLCPSRRLQSLGGSVLCTCRMAFLACSPASSAWWAYELHAGAWERLRPLSSAEQSQAVPPSPGPGPWSLVTGPVLLQSCSMGLTAGHTHIVTRGTPPRDRVWALGVSGRAQAWNGVGTTWVPVNVRKGFRARR